MILPRPRSQPLSQAFGVEASQSEEDLGQAADWASGPEALIRKNFLVGNRTAAVEICLKCGRLADALVIAYQDPVLFSRVRDEYIRKQNDPFLQTMGFVVKGQLEELVSKSDLKKWRETLAIVATYSQTGEIYRSFL